MVLVFETLAGEKVGIKNIEILWYCVWWWYTYLLCWYEI